VETSKKSKEIKQSAELSDSLIRLARKLQNQSKKRDQEQGISALHTKLTELRSYIDVVKRELGPLRYYDEAYAKARQGVAEQTATPQEAVIELLRAAVSDKTMSPDFAVEQLAKLLRPDLSASLRIKIRQTAKAAFEAGDDVVSKIRPFLKGAQQQEANLRDKKIREAAKNTLSFQM
jgi:uncharacterized coiled-coil protein SlyX